MADAYDGRVAALEAELQTVRESERAFRAAAALAERLVWTADPEGRITSVSEAFATLLGAPDDALGDQWQQVTHPDDLPAVAAAWQRSVETGSRHTAEFRVRMADGSYHMMLTRAEPERDADGRIVRWYGSSVDVHDAHLARAARQEAEERYRLAAAATTDAIWDYDVAAGTLEWSDMAARLFGFPEPIGVTSVAWWEERIHPDDRAAVARSLSEAIEGTAERWSAAYRFQRHDGSYSDILDRGFIIRVGGRATRAVGAMSDLTERNQAEAEIHRMQAELLQVSRISAMGTMAATLAHELNQPLAALSNYVRAARRFAEKAPDDPRLLEALDEAESGAHRAAEIVRRLREFVRRGTVDVAVHDLKRLIDEACTLALIDRESRGIVMRVELDPACPKVRADGVQVQQVLINLIRNAVDAMAHLARPEITITSHPAGEDMIEVCVADRGHGLQGEPDRLFSRFMTTKAEGMGIGLPISRTIVEAHGGTIWAEDREGGGAVFRFTLPRVRV